MPAHPAPPAVARRDLAALVAAIAALHVAGFGLFFAVALPAGSGAVIGAGLALTAYTLGLRHAFDADHIGAIDSTTRKLMAEGQRPVSVGFWFALGHSSVVFALAALLAMGIRGLQANVADDGSTLQQVTGVVGPLVSGGFLLLIGALNLVLLAGIVRVFRRMRHGEVDAAELADRLEGGGALRRLVVRATGVIRRPWHMYPLGLLFGLGFDTATEVALLATAGAAATSGLPVVAILSLPLLFAAGMTLLDTLNGAFMRHAYGWALHRPVRRIYVNMAITALSVGVALVIGTVELLQVLADRLDLAGGFWEQLAALDLNTLGFVVVGLFVLTWGAALAVWRFGRIEERWADAG